MMDQFHKDIENCKSEFYIYNFTTSKLHTTEHQHTKGQFLYAEGGVLHVFLNQQHWYIPGRCFLWIPSNTPHYILSNSKQVTMFGLYLDISPEDDPFFKEANVYLVDDLLREMIWFTKNWSGCIASHDEAKYHFLKAVKSNLPSMCHKVTGLPIQHPYPKDKRLINIGIYLKNNLETNYSLDEIAKEFGFSTRTLSRLFKEDMGMSYVKFSRALRLARALELMAESNLNVYEIAVKVGYISLSNFSNLFYRIMGIRPQEYMVKIRKSE